MKIDMKNYCYLFTTRNNYRCFDDIVFSKSDKRFQDSEIYNIDVNSETEQVSLGLEIMDKYGIIPIQPNKSALPMQYCVDETIQYLDKINNSKDWIIWMQHDSYIDDPNFFNNLDKELSNQFYIDNVGIFGTVVNGKSDLVARANLLKDSYSTKYRGWYRQLPNEYFDVENFLVESTMWTTVIVNVKLWKKYIKPDPTFKLLYSFDDVSHQFSLHNIPSLVLTSLNTHHNVHKFHGTSTGSSERYYPELAHGKGTWHLNWYKKWGWPWGVRNQWNHDIREQFTNKAEQYKNTIQEKLFNINISDGPIEILCNKDLENFIYG